jgi:hypothetical protein
MKHTETAHHLKVTTPKISTLISAMLSGCRFFGSALHLILISLVSTLFPSTLVYADFNFNVSSSVAPCDEFATKVLSDPWDMNNNADIVNFTTNDLTFLSNTNFSSGLFSMDTTLTGGGTFRLLAPRLPSAIPLGGRWGSTTPIDTNKYKSLTVRMSMDTLDNGQGLRFVWNRTPDYGRQNTFTNKIVTRTGWASYSVDFTNIGIDSLSENTTPWSSGTIEGLGVLPSVTLQRVAVDYVRLEDPSSCGSANLNYTVSPSANGSLYSMYIDSDTNPFNGYYKKILTAESSASGSTQISSLGLEPGNYNVIGIQDNDYATLFRDDAWDMSQSTDIQITGGAADVAFSNGIMSGRVTAPSGGPQFYLRLDHQTKPNLSLYNKLSFKISPRVDVNVLGTTFFANNVDADGDGVYQINLANTGSVDSLVIVPAWPTGTNFTLDFVELRSSGFVTTDTLPLAAQGAQSFTVSTPPILKIIEPSIKGGEALRPWNFRQGDTAFSVNLNNGSDPLYPSESLSAYLPDVRRVSLLRGDFFKGTNITGNDDPNDYLTFPQFTNTNNYIIDASQYKNLCLKMAVDRDYDLALGSVTKLIFNREDGAVEELEAWGTITDRWTGSPWYEYCSDLTTHYTEKGEFGRWSGNLKYLRIDPHEFHLDSCCDNKGNPIGNPINSTYYYDYLKLRKDDVSHGKYVIVYDAQDTDSSSLTPTFYYNSKKSATGGTVIQNSQLQCEGKICIWDTNGVPNGTYYIYGTLSDGASSASSLGQGRVQVLNDNAALTQPVLNIEAPSNNSTVCSTIQLKGFSLLSTRFEDVSAVQVFLDGSYLTSLDHSDYSPKAVTEYPNADASNTGFDRKLSVANWSVGNHNVVIKSYASDGGISSQSFTITKQNGCNDPATVNDAEPGGVATAANLLDASVGTGLSLKITENNGELDYLISGAKNCSIVRLGTAKEAKGPFTWFYGNTDATTLESNLIAVKSSKVPRFIGPKQASVPQSDKALSKLKNKLKKTSKSCKTKKSKAKCKKSIKKIKKEIKELTENQGNGQSASSTAVYFVTDCNQGSVTSDVKNLEASTFGNPEGAPCGSPQTISFADWFGCYATTLGLNTSTE